MHTIEVDQFVLEAEDGLLLGNGDLSLSIYQRSEHLVWRFGKNDVWDRRVDLSDDAEPAHIDEIARGIRDEGWVSQGYRDGRGKATKGTSDPERMREICDPCPSYAKRPYPCPKPVGELWMHLPIDKHELKIHQKLTVEKAEAEITITWAEGGLIRLLCFVHPKTNVLVVRWQVEDWNEQTALGHQVPVWFTLRRWADPTIEQFRWELFDRARNPHIGYPDEPGQCTPLPPPTARQLAGRWVIEQTFYPDLEYADGFRYAMMPFTTGLNLDPVDVGPGAGASIHLWGNDDVLEGWTCVAVPCSSDEGGMEGEATRLAGLLSGDPVGVFKQWRDETHQSAEAFWAKSAVEMDDKLLEDTWYETLYLRRCTYRADVIAPGLALPSTVQDYSMWHGDYHMNFNYQQPFYGDYGANHLELGDAYFPGLDYMIDLGRKIAQDSFNCRGTFVTLSGYPFKIDQDPFGTGPLSRLVYPTGWAMNQYWSRYLHTQDEAWLRDVGYPVIRDCALFFTDFLQKGDDGFYHAFPSIEGESFFTGRVEDYTDQPQVLADARYCLESAVKAADVLDVEAELREQWQEIVDHLASWIDLDALGLSDEDQRRYWLCPPVVQRPAGRSDEPSEHLQQALDNHQWRASFNTLPWFWLMDLRSGAFCPERDLARVKDQIVRWRAPGGHLRSMTASDHGYIGAYGESMGVICPIQELMLQSWDGVIRLFPAWPKDRNGRFETLRAEGAFLVSAAWREGQVESLSILSERGKRCRVASPWPGGLEVVDSSGRPVGTTVESENIACFDTEPGGQYELRPRSS